MSNMLKTGVDWLYDQLQDDASSMVTYSRGDTSVSRSAIVAGTRTEVVADDGASHKVEQRDFIFLAADLDVANVFPPARGDWITFEGRSYEVLPRGPDEDVWRWSDRHHKAVRVFAKSRSST